MAKDITDFNCSVNDLMKLLFDVVSTNLFPEFGNFKGKNGINWLELIKPSTHI